MAFQRQWWLSRVTGGVKGPQEDARCHQHWKYGRGSARSKVKTRLSDLRGLINQQCCYWARSGAPDQREGTVQLCVHWVHSDLVLHGLVREVFWWSGLRSENSPQILLSINHEGRREKSASLLFHFRCPPFFASCCITVRCPALSYYLTCRHYGEPMGFAACTTQWVIRARSLLSLLHTQQPTTF